MLVGALMLAIVGIVTPDGPDSLSSNPSTNTIFVSLSALKDKELLLNVGNPSHPAVSKFNDTLHTVLQEHNVVVTNWVNGDKNELLAFERLSIRRYKNIIGAVELNFNENSVMGSLMYSRTWPNSPYALVNLMDNVVLRMNNNTQAEIAAKFELRSVMNPSERDLKYRKHITNCEY